MTYPLSGLKIVDLSQIYNGPYATYLLALGGADVIKIEPPGGESLRRRAAVGGAALPFAMLNGCKRSLVLNLKTPEGKAALKTLVSDADVIVENFAPGVMDRLELGADTLMALNPRLIYASSSGFGRDGPYSRYPAMDLTVQAMGGIIHTTGQPDQPPVKAGPAVADFFAGIHLYGAIVTALYERERTGAARRVEVAMQDAVYASLSSNLGLHWGGQGSEAPQRTGNRHGGMAESPYNVYPTADGYIAIICVGEAHWRSLAKVMDAEALADDPRFTTLKSRVAHMDLIDATVSDWTSRHATAEIFEKLMSAHVPSAPVRTLEEVVNDPNMHARGALTHIDHPEYGRIVVQQSPFCFDGVPRMPLTPSQPLGADMQAILAADLGYDDETIRRATTNQIGEE
ncbi:CoA transferase [Sphingomonas koreensis]|uniref:CoA transferase n=1 Tax=Sphingomonas koreensis TaxID=93064 RepID=A0A430G1W3_9SPHN|nr:CoA transferase [Sphingomonas koreensis]RSY82020.1 CoA transferase [Sphingomonas koreensis]